jgi:hypothetical protein
MLNDLGGPPLQRLAGFVGTRWRFITGDPLAQRPGSLIAFGLVVAATDACELGVQSDVGVLGFEGYDEEYPRLSVADPDPGAVQALRTSGRLFFQHSGEQVRDVAVVRVEIASLRDGAVHWVYSTDMGVVFELSEGAVAIVKAGHHDDALIVAFGASADALDLPDRTIEWDWDNEPGQEYRTRRDLIPLESLLR